MYQEEKVINGILHYRTHPSGEWIMYSEKQLTEKLAKKDAVIISQAKELESHEQRWEEARKLLVKAENALGALKNESYSQKGVAGISGRTRRRSGQQVCF